MEAFIRIALDEEVPRPKLSTLKETIWRVLLNCLFSNVNSCIPSRFHFFMLDRALGRPLLFYSPGCYFYISEAS